MSVLVTESSPSHRQSLIRKAQALDQMGNKLAAGEIYSSLVDADPDDLQARVAYIWTYHVPGKYAEAVELWAEVRARWPDNDSGYSGGAGALMALKRFDEAEAMLLEVMKRKPQVVSFREGYARCAMRRGAYEEAVRRWTTVRELKPSNVAAYVEAAASLAELALFDQAHKILDIAPDEIKGSLRWLAGRAQLAIKRHDLFQALASWGEVATTYPGSVDGYVGAFDVLQRLGRLEDAENAIIPALRMFPDSLEVARRQAWLAHHRADWEDAARRWQRLREKFPEHSMGYAGTVVSLRAAGLYDEAETFVREALEKFPGDLELLLQHARIANARRNWGEALARFNEINAGFPGALGAYRGYVETLMQAARFDEAETIVKNWRQQLGNSAKVAHAYAMIATRRADWTTAEVRWSEAVAAFPYALELYIGLASSRCLAGRFEESKKALAAAAKIYPNALDIELTYAETLSAERDWLTVLPLWAELKRKYPSHPGVTKSLGHALWQAQLDCTLLSPENRFEIPALLLKPNEEQAGSSVEIRDLFMKFESIGDTCEFGIAQRRFGADPLGLLRWAHTRPADLVRALDDQLRGVGDPEFTRVIVDNGEYLTQDRRYFMSSHTFTRQSAVTYDKFYAQQCKRLKYLRDKFLNDLANPEKIFVYKSNYGLTQQQARDIHAALRRHGGSAWLLCMRLIDADHAAGDLEELDAGLYIGYTDRFSTIDVNIPNWVSVCRRVFARWDEERRYQHDV